MRRFYEAFGFLPWDVSIAYGAVSFFVAWQALRVLAGPALLLMLMGLPIYPLLIWSLAVLAFGLARRRNVPQRLLPALLVAACLASFCLVPFGTDVELHVAYQVYLSGGPNALNDWAQPLMKDNGGTTRHLHREDVPERIQKHLGHHVSVYDNLVRIELGGGFLHYGVLVVPRARAPAPEWWQNLTGWPSEVIVYRGDD